MKNILKLFVLLIFVLFGAGNVFATPAGDNILITEVVYDPTGIEPDLEWFELYNPTAVPIDINGWTVTDGEGSVNFIVSVVINPGEYKVIVYDGTAFQSMYGFWADYEYGVGAFGDSNLQFANTGDDLTLLDGALPVDFVSWEDFTPTWSVSAGDGQSIARSTFLDTDTNADWTGNVSPTPKAAFNNTPTAIALDGGNSLSITENQSFGTTIATITTTDADAGDSHSYSLVAGIGDEDNSRFSISGSNLELSFSPDFETPVDLGDTAGNNTYAIRIETDDGRGGTFEQAFIITVVDIADETAPIISLVGDSSIDIYENKTYIDDGATALDDVDGDITGNIITINPVDTSVIGTYIVTYNVDDAAGNSATEVTRTVNVIEKKKSSKKISKSKLAEIFGKKEAETEETKVDERNNNTPCSINYSRLIKRGLKGEDVRQVQQCLLNMGFPLPIYGADGWYGAETYNQITSYQQSKGLRYIDGIVGPETSGSLNLNGVEVN